MELQQSLQHCSAQVHQTLDEFFVAQLKEAKRIDRYLFRSVSFLQDFSLRGGKYVRPYLALLAFQLAGGKLSKGAFKAFASIELHHKHILVLDDIADRDEVRYGGRTLEYMYHSQFTGRPDKHHRSLSFAMLDGVFLGALSRELLASSKFSPEKIFAVQHIFNTTMYRDTLAGWQIHGMQCIENIQKSKLKEFIKGLELVTASYTFEGPLRIGLTLAGNTDKTLEKALTAYSKAVGTAFQIQDDILGLFGESKVTGKPVGNDVREGKKTLLLQYAYQKGTPTQKRFLQTVIGKPLKIRDLKKIQEIVTKTGSLAYSKKRASDFVQKGIAALSTLKDSQPKQLLIALAQYCITREK